MSRSIIMRHIAILAVLIIVCAFCMKGNDFDIVKTKSISVDSDTSELSYDVLVSDTTVKHGAYFSFSKRDRIRSNGFYIGNKKHGMWMKRTIKDKSPIILAVRIYKNDKLIYDVNLADTLSYNKLTNDSVRDGFWFIYDQGLQSECAYFYKNGKLHGYAVENGVNSFSNEKIVREVEYKDGMRTGSSRTTYCKSIIDDDGNMTSTYYSYYSIFSEDKLVDFCCYPDSADKGTFKSGTGTIKVYYPSGFLREERSFRNGMQEGTCNFYVEFSSPGRPTRYYLFMTQEYKNNLENGEKVLYNDRHFRVMKGSFVNGLAEGAFQHFEDTLRPDSVTRTVMFKNGIREY